MLDKIALYNEQEKKHKIFNAAPCESGLRERKELLKSS